MFWTDALTETRSHLDLDSILKIEKPIGIWSLKYALARQQEADWMIPAERVLYDDERYKKRKKAGPERPTWLEQDKDSPPPTKRYNSYFNTRNPNSWFAKAVQYKQSLWRRMSEIQTLFQ